jgi:hypothetical protein
MGYPGMFTVEQQRVARNILAIARKFYVYDHVPDLIHLGVTKQESDWNDTIQGDQGQSNGCYQIYTAAHPEITAGVACDPWYDYGFPTMHDRWAGAWLSYAMQWPQASVEDRGRMLELFAPAAQGSISWPPGLGQQRYHEAVMMLEILS